MIKLKSQQQVAEAYFVMKQLEKALKNAPTLKPGEYDLSGRELTFNIVEGSKVTRGSGEKGDGIVKKTATQKLYGWAMIYAIVHHLSRYLAKFRLDKKAEKLMISLVRKIVKKSLETDVTSEEAFRELHPRVAEGIDDMKDKMRGKLGTIDYPTVRKAKGDMGMKSKAA